jgi:predicted DNA-binding transcriptional regulator AlpA
MDHETHTQTRRLVSIGDGMKLLPVGQTTFYGLMSSGAITRVKIGRRAFITRASIDAYIDRLTAAAESDGAA